MLSIAADVFVADNFLFDIDLDIVYINSRNKEIMRTFKLAL